VTGSDISFVQVIPSPRCHPRATQHVIRLATFSCCFRPSLIRESGPSYLPSCSFFPPSVGFFSMSPSSYKSHTKIAWFAAVTRRVTLWRSSDVAFSSFVHSFPNERFGPSSCSPSGDAYLCSTACQCRSPALFFQTRDPASVTFGRLPLTSSPDGASVLRCYFFSSSRHDFNMTGAPKPFFHLSKPPTRNALFCEILERS